MFAELKLTTVDRCSVLNYTNKFLISAVCRTAAITMQIKIQTQLLHTSLSDRICRQLNTVPVMFIYIEMKDLPRLSP